MNVLSTDLCMGAGGKWWTKQTILPSDKAYLILARTRRQTINTHDVMSGSDNTMKQIKVEE